MTSMPSGAESTTAPHNPKSRQVELLISNLLRLGVLLSLSCVVIGAVISFGHHREYLSDSSALQRLTTPGSASPRSIRDVVHGLARFRGQAVVALGLLLLIATPVVRVAVSIVGFIYEHDRTYAIITSCVLVLLTISFFIGRLE